MAKDTTKSNNDPAGSGANLGGGGDGEFVRQGGGGETVTVACKVPNGLHLRLFNMIEVDEPVYGGGMKRVKRPMVNTEAGSVILKGPAVLKGFAPDHEIAGGYGLTSGVSRDFFEEWLKQNQSHPAVKNQMVFACESTNRARAQAKEMAGVRSGAEPLAQDPSKDGRVGRNRALTLEKADTKDQ